MTTIPAPAEIAHERLHEAADRYRADGYRVTIAPSAKDLPEPLRRFPPDLLATKGRETIAIVVRRRDMPGKEIKDLTDAIVSQPGWHLDLWLEPRGVHSEILDPNAEVSQEDVQQTLARARALEHPDLALVVAWRALELAMIHAARVSNVEIPRDVMGTVSTSCSFGLISYNEYKKLYEAWDARVRIVHGYKAESDLQPLVDAVISVAEQLITTGMTD